jgi:DNA repair protein RadD
MMQLRAYQSYVVDALFNYFHVSKGNPVVAMPTGTGKSIIIGEFCRRARTQYPQTRILMVTHVKELIEQNMARMLEIWPTAPAGIYSAGLKRRESYAPITFAGIASIYKKAEIFGFIDLVLIDECHLVSQKSESMYHNFLADLRKTNPLLKVIGLSATPYRLGQGMLTDEGGLFTDVCVDLTSRDSFNHLIAEGWLVPLIPKKTQAQLDVSNVKMSGGEYIQSELQRAVDKQPITYAALRETIAVAQNRRRWLVFASGIEHAEHVAGMLVDMGIDASFVHSGLDNDERDRRIADFRAGRIRAMVNNNVLTTGFDLPEIDCIVMLRPTASPGLWVQMLGRGTRPCPWEGKTNCLVLDFAGNTARLGPINDPVLPRRKGQKNMGGVAPVKLCDYCGTYNHASVRYCIECGALFPKQVKLYAQASMQELIAGVLPKIEKFKVDFILYNLKQKDGRPDMMRVDYHCALRRFTEYIMLDHKGYPAHLARQWWEMRLPKGYNIPTSVAEGMELVKHLRTPTYVRVALKPKYNEVCGYEFNGDVEQTSVQSAGVALINAMKEAAARNG